MIKRTKNNKKETMFNTYEFPSFDEIIEKVVNPKVWIDEIVIYHSKIEQKASTSSMNKLYEIPNLVMEAINGD